MLHIGKLSTNDTASAHGVHVAYPTTSPTSHAIETTKFFPKYGTDFKKSVPKFPKKTYPGREFPDVEKRVVGARRVQIGVRSGHLVRDVLVETERENDRKRRPRCVEVGRVP